jgi:CubicO group peptidase (beta-lactamase class C family)
VWPRAASTALLALVVCAGPLVAAAGEASDPAPLVAPLALERPVDAIARELRQLVPRRMRERGVPGLAIALVRDAKIAWSAGFGTTRNGWGRPITADTVFEVASNGKATAALAALALVEAGRLDLDQVIEAQGITVRHVLTHTSGLTNDVTHRNTRLLFPPGERFSYSGAGFLLLQEAIEAETGQPFDAYMQRRVFGPLGMRSSGYVLDAGRGERLAHGHLPGWMAFFAVAVLLAGCFGLLALGPWIFARLRGRRLGRTLLLLLGALSAGAVSAALSWLFGVRQAAFGLAVFAVCAGPPLWLLPRARRRGGLRRAALAAVALLVPLLVLTRPALPMPERVFAEPHAAYTLYSTANDLGRFLIEIMQPQTVSPATIAQFVSPHVDVNERVSWGLGIGVQRGDAHRSVWQWGQNPGYESLVVAYPEQRIGVVILTNATGGLAIAREIAYRAIGGEHYDYWDF